MSQSQKPQPPPRRAPSLESLDDIDDLKSAKTPPPLNPDGVENMESLIPVTNTIRDLIMKTGGSADGDERDIKFPEIVAVGSQSAGKTSLLESIVGHQFLPRGSGIVTRCPIVIRMVSQTQPLQDGTTEYVEFEHKPNEFFTDFQRVEREIVEKTKLIAGTNFGISNDPIKLTFYSPKVLNLTIVDLPGMVKIPVGDQPEDIESQIKNLILNYISQENCIILAVSPGDSDIANSESINIAKQVDPQQRRTIAVVTKLDLAPDKARMAEVLKGRVYPIKLGIYGVINNPDVDEQQFLRTSYPTIASQHGIPFLTKKLNKILQTHIAAACPGLKTSIQNLIQNAEQQLEALGNHKELDEEDKRRIMTKTIELFSKNYKSQVDGQQRSNLQADTLTSASVLRCLIGERLVADLNEVSALDSLTDEKIMTAIANSMPVEARMITPEAVINHFAKIEIARIAPLSKITADLCNQEMIKMIQTCLEVDLELRFPKLNPSICKVVQDLLDRQIKETKKSLELYFKIHSAAAFTSDPGFAEKFRDKMSAISVMDVGSLPRNMSSGGSHSILSSGRSFTPDKPEVLTPEQETLLTEVRELAEEVFKIVRSQAQDFIAKAILSILVYDSVESVGEELTMELNTPENIEILVRESEEVYGRRMGLKHQIDEDKKALSLIEGLISQSFNT